MNASIERLYETVEAGRRAIKAANKLGQSERSRAFTLYNEHAARLRHAQNGTKPKRKYGADFNMTVAGIPCGVYIVSWRHGVEWYLLDLNGYRAEWLEAKVTDAIENEIIDACYAHDRKLADEF